MSSAYGGLANVGRNVRFTPNGLSVISWQRLIAAASFSGVPSVSAVIMPSPPALETADASSGNPTKCMPPWMIGCWMPKSSVMRVFMGGLGFLLGNNRPLSPIRSATAHLRKRPT